MGLGNDLAEEKMEEIAEERAGIVKKKCEETPLCSQNTWGGNRLIYSELY